MMSTKILLLDETLNWQTLFQCLCWARRRSQTWGKCVKCCGLMLSLITSSFNPFEQHEIAIEGCTVYNYPPIDKISNPHLNTVAIFPIFPFWAISVGNSTQIHSLPNNSHSTLFSLHSVNHPTIQVPVIHQSFSQSFSHVVNKSVMMPNNTIWMLVTGGDVLIKMTGPI